VNPFDLHGPEFLLFFFVFSVLVIVTVILLRQRDVPPPAGIPPLDDPYLVAFLRGGEGEALRVVTLSLIDRGLLTLKSFGRVSLFSKDPENYLEMKDPSAIDTVKRPIEKRVLEAFKKLHPINSTLDSLVGCTACIDYAKKLEQFGFLPSPEMRSTWRRRYQIAVVIILGVAGLKIIIALSRGRTNILFLIFLAILAAYVTARFGNSFRTARGEEFLEDTKSLFGTLRQRATSLRPGGATSDLAWLASSHGLLAVPPVLFPQVSALLPRKPKGGLGSRGWGSGNSCGSCSSCGGGGCGGGGCGGGGCGGCGS